MLLLAKIESLTLTANTFDLIFGIKIKVCSVLLCSIEPEAYTHLHKSLDCYNFLSVLFQGITLVCFN